MKWGTMNFGQRLGNPKDPYMKRWTFETKQFSIRLHHWLSSDDLRYPHDHPWDFISFILKGGYEDVSPDGSKTYDAGSFHCVKAEHKHSVNVNPGGCWSLLLTGPDRRKWGFWVNGKFRKRNKYFYEHGHH